MRIINNYLFSVSIIYFFVLSAYATNEITVVLPITTQQSLEPVQANLIKRINDIIRQEIDALRDVENSNLKEISFYPIVKPAVLGYLPIFSGVLPQAHDLALLKKQCELLQILPIASSALLLPIKQEFLVSEDELSIVLIIEDGDKKLAQMHADIKAGMQSLNDLYAAHYKKTFINESSVRSLWDDPRIELVHLPKNEVHQLVQDEQLWKTIIERIKRDVFTKIKLPVTQCTIEAMLLANQEKSGSYTLFERYPFQVKSK